jgi:hypothetical protein
MIRDELEELLKLTNAERPINGYGWHPNKVLRELEWAKRLLELLKVKAASVEGNTQDPPDVVVMLHNKKIGIELTEFMDGDALKEFKKSLKNKKYECINYPKLFSLSELVKRITEIMNCKSNALSRWRDCDERWLLIHSDEFSLTKEGLIKACGAVEKKHFDKIYFMQSYCPLEQKNILVEIKSHA